jgi:hypothetical protein
MKPIYWIILLVVLFTNCNSHKESKTKSELDECEQLGYSLFTYKYSSYTDWKMAYLDHITFCLEDSDKVIQLAKMDAIKGDYTIFIYGLMDQTEPYETIYEKYPISFHCPGCVSSNMGEIYNSEMKKYLKQNEGLDYDSIYQAEMKKLEAEI